MRGPWAGNPSRPRTHPILRSSPFSLPLQNQPSLLSPVPFVAVMRLLDTETGQFVEKDPERSNTVYAILSHTWDTENGEQTYTELKEIQRRYGPGSTAEGGISSVPDSKHDRSFPLPSSQPPNASPLLTTRPLPAIGCLTPSEVEALFRAFGEAYGLTIPTTSALASSDPFASASGCQVAELPQSIWDDPELSPKIRDACAVARKNGYRYIWIDSCCIDKSSSSQLSEAINSMYKWYGLASVCYVYLADVPPGDDHHAKDSHFCRSRWFMRGWTLQELIAPINVEFLSQDWSPIGSKYVLDSLVESITKISRRALLHLEPLNKFSIAQRLSWAAMRQTTRAEDMAYSLLGIFDINMPTLYGEGERAFQRLQEQIMHLIPDQSLFAWGRLSLPDSSQLLENHIPIGSPIICRTDRYRRDQSPSAKYPFDFKTSRNIRNIQLPASLHHEIGYTSTPYGIRTQFQMIPLTPDLLSYILPSHKVELNLQLDDLNQWYLAILGCEHTEHPGYLLGRVCYIPPSKSGVEFVYAGLIDFGPGFLEQLPLSLETITHSQPHLELKTVYVPHPNSDSTDLQLRGIRFKPYNTIKLVLLTETRDALRSQGYWANLRDPDPDHPTTHWLTLPNDEHTITVEFQHTLSDDGGRFAINAGVKMSGSRVQLDSVPDSDQAGRHIMSWSSRPGWDAHFVPGVVKLSPAGAKMLTVDLSLDFAGSGVCFVYIDVRSDVPPAPANVDLAPPVSPAVESAERGKRGGGSWRWLAFGRG